MPGTIRIEHGDKSFNVADTADRIFIADLFGVPRSALIGLRVGKDTVIPLSEGKSLSEAELALIGGRAVSCQLAGPDWSTATQMRLGGGTGGRTGECIYIPAPGIKVASSAPVYNNQNYFYMQYLFEGESTAVSHAQYWLTTSTGAQTLSFSFERPCDIALIRVCATAYLGLVDRRCNYRITVTSLLGGARIVTGGFVDTEHDAYGSYHAHIVQEQHVIQVLFELTKEANHVCLKKIEIWSLT
jgi:hypothetical protein